MYVNPLVPIYWVLLEYHTFVSWLPKCSLPFISVLRYHSNGRRQSRLIRRCGDGLILYYLRKVLSEYASLAAALMYVINISSPTSRALKVLQVDPRRIILTSNG